MTDTDDIADSAPDNYVTITPFGAVDALFGYDAGVTLNGTPDAVACVQRAIEASTNALGMTMTVDNVEPADYFNFCQGPATGILIIEPAEVELLPPQPEEPQETEEQAALDSADDEERVLRREIDGVADPLVKLRLARALAVVRELGAGGLPSDPDAAWVQALAAADGSVREAGRAYLRFLQGSSVETVIGPVLLTHKTSEKMRMHLANNDLKGRLIPRVPEILQGTYLGSSPSDKVRHDGMTVFHYFAKTMMVGDMSVTAGVSVGEYATGAKVLTAYDLATRMYGKWLDKTKGTPLNPGQKSQGGVPSDATTQEEPGSRPHGGVLDDAGSMALEADQVNDEAEGLDIVILQVLAADGAPMPELTDIPTEAPAGAQQQETVMDTANPTADEAIKTAEEDAKPHVGRTDGDDLALDDADDGDGYVIDPDDVFDPEEEFAATPGAEGEGDITTLDGDFAGHAFRGNQYRKGSHESRGAVHASMRAKRAEQKGDHKAAKAAHRAAYHAHKAAAEFATGKTKAYHATMAKFHHERSKRGAKLDGVTEQVQQQTAAPAQVQRLDSADSVGDARAAFAAAQGVMARLAAAQAILAARQAAAAEDEGMSPEERKQVAITILQQLGGNKFKVMTGAKNATALGPESGAPNGGLSFSLPTGFSQLNGKSTGINRVFIRLNAEDTYDVEFGGMRAGAYTVRAKTEGIYADSLREVFTRYTGLDTSLGTAGKIGSRTVSKKEATEAYDSLDYAYQDLQGHTAMEMQRAGSTDRIEAAVEALRRLEPDWPAGLQPLPRNLIERAENLIDTVRKLREEGGKIEIGAGDVKSWYFQGSTLTDEQKAAILANPYRVIESGQFKVPKYIKADVEAAVAAAAAANAAAASAGPAKYPDGRTIPQIGDKVYDRVAGMFGMGAVLNGIVAQGSNGLIVRITGSGDMLGGRVTTKTTPLTAAWTLMGEEHPRDRAIRESQAKLEADENTRRSEHEAMLAEAEARNGTLDPATAKLGDVLEVYDGAIVYVREIGKDGTLYVQSLDKDGPYHGGSLGEYRGVKLRPDVALPTDGSIDIRTADDVVQALYPDGWVPVEWSDEAQAYVRLTPAPAAVEGADQFRYALMNRPADIGTIPKGLQYTVEPRPAEGQPHYEMARHGILVTNRELTAEEVKAFELAPLVDGADLGVLAEKIASGGMAEYANSYVEMARDEPANFAHMVMESVRRAGSGVTYSIGDPDALVQMVLDKLKATIPAPIVQTEPAAIDPAAVNPVNDPTVTPPAADPVRSEAMAMLSMVAAGTHPDMLEPELADQIEQVLTRYPDDADIQAAGEKAIVAYSNGLMAATGG